MRNFLVALFSLAFLFPTQKSFAQNLLNGDFENNSGTCIVNATNAYINLNVADVTAYGAGDEIDMMDCTCGYGGAKSGSFFLCLANSSGFSPDAITLTLSAALDSGTAYSLCYYDRAWNLYGCCPPGVPLEVGISTTATSQGSVVYTSPVPDLNSWTLRTINFIAPNNGLYISFQAEMNSMRWTHIDDIQLNVCNSPSIGCCILSTLDFTQVNETCGHGNGSATVTPSGGPAPYTYSWNTLPVQTTATATGLAEGTYAVSVTDSLGCTTFGSVIILNVNQLNLTVNPSSPVICYGDSVMLTASGAANYFWSPSEGLNPVNDSVVSGFPFSTTTYTLTGTDNACIDSITVMVTVQLLPVSTFSILSSTPCEGVDVAITYTGGSLPGATYNWNFNGGIITSGTGQGPYQVHWNNGGIYASSLAVTENGCTSLPSMNSVTIYAPPESSFAIAPPEICAGKMVEVYYTGHASASSIYNWGFGAGMVLQGSGQGPYILQYNSAGDQLVTLTVTEHGCHSSQSDTLQVDSIPLASFVASDTTGCDSLFVQFINLSGAATSYQWDFGDGTSDTSSNPIKTYGIGSYKVRLIATSSHGCTDTFTIPNYIHVYHTSIAQFSVNPAANVPLFLRDANFQFSNLSLNASAFWWDFGDSTFSGAADPSHQYTSTGNYTVTLFAYDGSCFDSTSVSFLMVDHNPSYFIPNAFTPNGDGINDYFKVLAFQFQSVHISIFNRWGNMIFESSDIDRGWDGTYKGKSVEIGGYIYFVNIIYINGKNESATGSVILIR